MKPILTHLIALLLGVTVAYVLFSSKDSAPSPTETAKKSAPTQSEEISQDSAVVKSNGEASSPPKAKPLTEELSMGTEDLPTLTKEKLEQYINSRGRHPHTLLQAALNSGDLTYFKEALSAAPDDPLLLYYASVENELNIPISKRVKYSEKLLELTPDNASAYYQHAANLSKIGDLSAAVTILNSAPLDAVLGNYENVILAESLDLQEATERSSALSKMATFAAQSNNKTDLLRLSKSLNTHARTLPENEAYELRSSLSSMGQQLQYAPTNLIDNIAGITISADALKDLPPGEASPYEGMTNVEALNYIASEKEQLKQVNRQVNLQELISSNPDLINRMMERQLIMGEREALQWVSTQIKNTEE